MRLPLLLPFALAISRSLAQAQEPSFSGDSSDLGPTNSAAPIDPSSPSASPSQPEETDFVPVSTIVQAQTETKSPPDIVGTATETDSAVGAPSPAPTAPEPAPAPATPPGGPPAAPGGGGPPPIRDPNRVFPYPQPPLPSVSATRNSNAWTLSPDFEITDVPTTREYTFDIAVAAAAPDGYARQIYAVNNQFPGPLIEANEGDEIVIHMNNHLDIGMAIHWHGMYQNGTAFMDGAPGVSQCPIPPGQSFTYRFKIENQYGSYWWHSHFGNTLADGLTGGLIVHSTRDPLKRGQDFDEEVVVMVQDWMDVQSTTVTHALLTDEGYRGGFAPPQGNAILINGLGRTNCSNPDRQDREAPCDPPLPAEIPVPVGKKVRLRVLNTGSFGMFRVSIDQHPFELVEVDDTAVWGPSGLHEVQITTGQRSSLIIDTDQGEVGAGFFFRANFVGTCLGPFAVPQTGLAVLRYVDWEGNTPHTEAPDTKAWDDLAGEDGPCHDIDEDYNLTPREPQDAPYDILQTHVMSSAAGVFVDKNGIRLGNFGINNVTYRNQIGYPLLSQVQDGHEIDGELVAHATFDNMGGGDIVINNLDGPISHPFHLHGKPFMIVARGEGKLTREQWEGMRHYTAKVHNPLRRDVLEISGGSYAVLRLYIDLPGVWPLHCHIGWHLSEGKLAALVYLPDKVRQLDQPEDWKAMCSHWGRDEFGPARRALTSPMDGPSSSQKRRRLERTGPREH